MLGRFGLLGRSRDLQRLDKELCALGLNSCRVPEAVKIAAGRLLGGLPDGGDPALRSRSAELLVFCMIGRDAFVTANGEDLAQAVEVRIGEALETGDSLDAQLIMLTLQARTTHPDLVERYGFEMD